MRAFVGEKELCEWSLSPKRHTAKVLCGIDHVPCLTIGCGVAGKVRVARIPLAESQGPCYARYVGAQLYRGETYYLQIDSHMTMVPRWCAAVETL